MSANKIASSHSKNTPKIGYSDESGVNLPGAFEVKKMTLIFSDGTSKEISKFVESFTITAELFSPVVTFSANLRDTEKLFDISSGVRSKIYGQENLEIEIRPGTEANKQGDLIKHTFSVKEYPTLTRTLDFPHTQTYTLLAISEFAYRSNLMNICRVLDDGKSLDKNIETIFKDDLRMEEIYNDPDPQNKFGFIVSGDIETKFKGIINIQRPLQAAEWLRSRSFTSEGSPFFLYSDTTRLGKIFLSSWEKLYSGPVVATYDFNPYTDKKPGTTAGQYRDWETDRKSVG